MSMFKKKMPKSAIRAMMKSKKAPKRLKEYWRKKGY